MPSRAVVMVLVVLKSVSGMGSDAVGGDIVASNYMQELAPWPEDNSPLLVNFSLKINNIVESKDKQLGVIIDCYFRVTWQDPRLNYPGSPDEGEIIINPVILDKIWLPDPYIFNVRSVQGVHILKDVQGVTISPDKSVFISSAMKIDLACSSKFEKYPFDSQICTLAIFSYMYAHPSFAMRWLDRGLVVDPAVSEQLTNYEYSFNIIPQNITCTCYACIPPDPPCVLASLKLTRKMMGYMLGTFLPSGLFVMVSWASFFWPADVIPGRTVLVITSLLTLISMHTAVRQSSPETSYMKGVDVWMFICILHSIFTLFEYGIVLYLMKRQKVSPVSKPVKTHQLVTKVIPVKPQVVKEISAGVDVPEERSQLKPEEKLEKLATWFLPISFLLFNIIYWPYYIT
ncbi:hypothetical protein Pmani_023067 [Petrolisthes manimaculis]|uniref:Uncharacterized protein n=1 Tax=Petrolisthes manimaculis TaxID=1843537 RepID=A0AAE1PAV2_9EUCA|nr:hypothetical protein Pmani_023067 [Petrolisthes manimaculis]